MTRSPHDRIAAADFIELLEHHADHHPDRLIYRFLLTGDVGAAGDGTVDEVSHAALRRRVRALAARLQSRCSAGDRVLLLFPPGPDYVVGVFACLYAGVIAVPAYPPELSRMERSLPRLQGIVRDCDAHVVLTLDAIARLAAGVTARAPELADRVWIAADTVEPAEAEGWIRPRVDHDAVALLQYTSGSTGAPRGVMLSHGNLVHNSRQIALAFGLTPESVGVIWLPPYHDMGLIGGILQSVFVGSQAILMSPLAFLQRPVRWLEAISHYRADVSGGPNFAYDLCARRVTDADRARLNLSAWRLAFNGAEPVRAATLDRFARALGPCGFRRAAFYPCYGLAEATLIVTGGEPDTAPPVTAFDADALAAGTARVEAPGAALVGCGHARLAQDVRIVDPEACVAVAGERVGEIWVQGESVARGYWNRPDETRATFDARLPGVGGPFLRTGDLGFMYAGQLYVTGRLKDVIVHRGRNLWPHDLEQTAERAHPSVRPGNVAAFSVSAHDGEGFAVIAEVRSEARQHADQWPAIAEAIAALIADEHGVAPVEVVLAAAQALPKTSSGKLQRFACRAGLADGTLAVLHRHAPASARRAPPPRPPALPSLSLMFFSSVAPAHGDQPRPAGEHLYGLFLDAVKAADRLGFEAVWIPERHFHPFGGLYPNPSTLAAAAAAVTERVRIRAGSVVLPLHDPLRVAEEWAVVDQLSGGRVDVAFALGWNPTDFVLAPDRFAERRAETFRGIETVRQLWRGEPLERRDGRGEITPVRVFPRPVQSPIPLWLTCSGGDERFVDAGERGFHVLTALLFQTPEELATRIARYREARARAGLDPAAGRVTVMLHAYVDEDERALDQAVRRPLEAYLESSVDLWRRESAPLASLDPSDRAAVLAYAAERYRRQSALIGTPAACSEMLLRMRRAGADEVACLIDFGVAAPAVAHSIAAIARLTGHAPAAGGPSNTASATPSPEVSGGAGVRDHALVVAIERLLTDVLGETHGPAGAGATFQARGVDSLSAVEIMHRLGVHVGRALPARLLFDHPTPSALAAHLSRIDAGDSGPATRSASELAADAVLPAEIVPGACSPRPGGRTPRFFLTGATGFFGAFLLRELLAQTHAEVRCLVRAPSEKAGLDRLRGALEEYDLWRDEFADRVVPVLGDLALPGLGLDEPARGALSDSLDAIYHNGALVNFAYDHATCRPANVGGTLAVLRLACHGGRAIPLHFVSTTALFSHAYAGRVMGPDDVPDDVTRLDMGYTQTKWVAERLVLGARDRGLPVTVFRPGLITGATGTGACHLTNFVWNLIRVSAEIGALPDYDRVIDMTPVDWAARVLVRRSLDANSAGSIHHLVNPRPISIADLRRWLNGRGYDVRTVPFERWQIQVMQRVTTAPALSALLPILSLAAADFYERRQVRFDSPLAAAPFVQMGDECPPVDTALLDTCAAWFVRKGFLHDPSGRRATAAVRVGDTLTARRLRDLTVQITGSSDLGDGDWVEPLTVLTDAMRAQVDFRPGGLERATTRLANAFIRRAQLAGVRRRHPEIDEIAIERPIFICAPPRTGTTLLHNLLAQDPAHRAFTLWEMLGPVTPAHGGGGWEQHLIGVAGAFVEETYERAPDLRAIHPLDPRAPDECQWLQSCNFTSLVHAAHSYVPEYVHWMLGHDQRASYRFLKRAQQALLWRNPGDTVVAKDPSHLWHLDALLATYPDATVVRLHRDMRETMASWCSLLCALQSVEARPPAARTIGRYGLDLLTAGMDRLMALREVHPPATLVDLSYRQLVADPVAAVRTIHRARGTGLTPATIHRMTAWLAEHRQGKHGTHHYGLGDFGLSTGEIDERFAAYTARFLAP